MNTIKNNKGFSLIELMIAVVIIGILAAIAIPNYQKYQRKSRQAEAKSTLAAMFTSEKSYIAEYGAGSSSLQAIGYGPEGRIVYNCGWATGSGARAARHNPPPAPALANEAVANTVDACTAAISPNCSNGIDDLVAGTAIASPANAVTPVNQTFTIACEAALDENNPNDNWTIDQAKALVNEADGT